MALQLQVNSWHETGLNCLQGPEPDVVPALCAGSWLISWGGKGDGEADTAQLAGARAWHSLWCGHREQPVWHDMAQHGMALNSTAWRSMARHSTAWHSVAWHGTVWHAGALHYHHHSGPPLAESLLMVALAALVAPQRPVVPSGASAVWAVHPGTEHPLHWI